MIICSSTFSYVLLCTLYLVQSYFAGGGSISPTSNNFW